MWQAADCEQDCGRFLAQPVDSRSSLGYLAAGVAVFVRAGQQGRRGVPAVFAAALAANAHRVVLPTTVPAARSGAGGLAALGAGGLAAAMLAFRPGASGRLQFVTGAAAAVSEGSRLIRQARTARLTERISGWRDTARELAPLAVIGAGAVLQSVSRTGGPWCRPASRWQEHSGWHLLSAAGLGWWGVRRASSSGPPHLS